MPNTNPGFRIEVFRTGTFKPMAGDAISYGADDLAGIASGYDPDGSPAPIVIGHPATDAPAYGWVSGFEYDETADRLFADIDDLDPAFEEAVKAGRYKKVSMSFHTPDAPNNPAPGQWYPKHIGFLGGAAPAVSGLQPVRRAAAAMLYRDGPSDKRQELLWRLDRAIFDPKGTAEPLKGFAKSFLQGT